MSHEDKNMDKDGKLPAGAGSRGVSRRTLLRTSVVGMPAMLTLHSGAALARSSNIIGVAPAGTRDLDGNALCLDTTYATPLSEGQQYDLGEPAQGQVNVLSERIYYPQANKSSTPVNADVVCNQGGPFYYQDSGWKEVKMPFNGAIVSTTAMVSVSLRGTVNITRMS